MLKQKVLLPSPVHTSPSSFTIAVQVQLPSVTNATVLFLRFNQATYISDRKGDKNKFQIETRDALVLWIKKRSIMKSCWCLLRLSNLVLSREASQGYFIFPFAFIALPYIAPIDLFFRSLERWLLNTKCSVTDKIDFFHNRTDIFFFWLRCSAHTYCLELNSANSSGSLLCPFEKREYLPNFILPWRMHSDTARFLLSVTKCSACLEFWCWGVVGVCFAVSKLCLGVLVRCCQLCCSGSCTSYRNWVTKFRDIVLKMLYANYRWETFTLAER